MINYSMYILLIKIIVLGEFGKYYIRIIFNMYFSKPYFEASTVSRNNLVSVLLKLLKWQLFTTPYNAGRIRQWL